MSKNVDLTLLKKLVSELELSLEAADKIKSVKGSENDWVVELNKATGLAAGVMAEAGMLAGDIQHSIAGGTSASGGKQAEFLDKLLVGFKVPGSSN
jgi:hypothetical protein